MRSKYLNSQWLHYVCCQFTSYHRLPINSFPGSNSCYLTFCEVWFQSWKKGRVLNISARSAMNFQEICPIIGICSRKEAILKYFCTTFYFRMFLRQNKTSNVSTKRYAKIGLPLQAPVCKLKCWVAVLPFITHDFFIFWQNPYQAKVMKS